MIVINNNLVTLACNCSRCNRTAADAFEDEGLRSQYASVAEAIRLPYWDWTNPRVPQLMTARTVTVLDRRTGEPTTISNPFGPYQYTVRGCCCWHQQVRSASYCVDVSPINLQTF